MTARPCIFEYIYFARPDSVVGGRNVYDVRKRLGAELAKESLVAADVVVRCRIAVCLLPLVFRKPRACLMSLGLFRNHYVGRTFIQPTQTIRELGVRMKHSANKAVVAGKRIILIDDSLVRGTTSVKLCG